MPEVKIERVVSVSSEDPIFKAENLLKNMKWRCQNNGESQVSVVLQLSKPVKIRLLELIKSINYLPIATPRYALQFLQTSLFTYWIYVCSNSIHRNHQRLHK